MKDAAQCVGALSKIIPISAIAGITGYVTRKLQTDGKKRRMRRQLYREISNNYHSIVVRIAAVTSIAGIR